MLVMMLYISIDFRLVLFVSCLLTFGAGLLSAKKNAPSGLLALIISFPFCAVFSIVIYPQIPQLIGFIAFIFPSAWLGVDIIRKKDTVRMSLLAALILITGYSAIKIVPIILEDELSKSITEDLESFTLIDMEGNKIESNDLAGKVVILDFFGTWCKPCIQELKELEKVYQTYSTNEDVEFFVINTAEAGDTVEKMNSFISSHNYSFQFGFDHDQQLVKQFDLHGVPYLFIIDKEGRLQYKHVGYNKGETHFVATVSDIIKKAL